MKKLIAAMATGLLGSTAYGDEQGSAFVEANILGIFYHELGHALIDVQRIPIFGQEEDAADVFSIFFIDALFEDESAKSIAYDAAFGFLGEAQARQEGGYEIPWWDVHGPDEQRFYNTVCLFYGADPDNRADLAEDLGLPEERAEYCPDEYAQAADSWGIVLEDISDNAPSDTIQYQGERGEGASLTEQILAAEIDALNEMFHLDDVITVTVEQCGEANAFYDPQARGIVFCEEFEDHLIQMEENL